MLRSTTEPGAGGREPGAGGRFRRRLRTLEPLAGTVVTVRDVALAELSAAPADFVWIDLEHGALGPADVQPLAVGARAAGSAALARLARPGQLGLGAILDAGVDGVVVPRVETAAEAAAIVDQLRHPPCGSRGYAVRRANGYGRGGAAVAPDEVACMVQIESAGGVDRAAQIAAVEGVDALMVGCADLALALGGTPELGSPALREAVERVQQAAAEAGIASGVAGPDEPELLAGLAGGRSTVFVLSADVRLYARALDAALARLRREAGLEACEPEDARVGS